jgi:hypothetical protein
LKWFLFFFNFILLFFSYQIWSLFFITIFLPWKCF